MCEADKHQLLNADFTKQVEGFYGPLAAIMNACGSAAASQRYPCHAQVVAFSPYYAGGRDKDVKEAAKIAQEAWDDDEGAAWHCNQTFHLGPLGCIATFTVAFYCAPQDIMLIF